MSHPLVESGSVFTVAVTVPDDLDPATAASINGAFQALADRTQYLKLAVGVQIPSGTKEARKLYAMPYAIDSLLQTGQTLSYVAQGHIATETALAIGDNGTKFYFAVEGAVYQYNLSTAYDLSTGAYAVKTFSFAAQETGAQDIKFSADGTKMYVLGTVNERIYQYTLSTPWDVSTAVYSTLNFLANAQEINPFGFCFSLDGSKMLIIGTNNDALFQYTLSTPWNISTAVYATKTLSVAAQTTAPIKCWWSSDGKQVFVTDGASIWRYRVNNYTGSFDLAITAYDQVTSRLSNFVGAGLAFDTDGMMMFVLDANTSRFVSFYSHRVLMTP